MTHGLSQWRAIQEAGRARWVQLALSVALHLVCLAGAILWGQGGRLPETANIPAISVEIVPAQDVQLARVNEQAAAQADSQPAASGDPEPSNAEAESAELVVPGAAHDPQPQAANGASENDAGHYGSLAAAIVEPEQSEAEQAAQSGNPPAAQSEPPSPPRKDGQQPSPDVNGEPAPITLLTEAPSTANRAQAMPRSRARGRRPARSRYGNALSFAALSYRRAVRGLIAQNLPAGGLGSGRVTVGLRLSASGAVLRVSVLRSSGNPVIDRAALASVRTAGPYPAAPGGISRSQLFLRIPFVFE